MVTEIRISIKKVWGGGGALQFLFCFVLTGSGTVCMVD